MSKAQFSLKERDRTRYIKDRVMRALVTSGGVGVLLALVLIFFYLVVIVLPIFSSADVTKVHQAQYHNASGAILGAGIDNYGENTYLFDDAGNLSYVSLKGNQEGNSAQTILTTNILADPTVSTSEYSATSWFGYGNDRGEVVAVKPSFTVSFTDRGRVLTPNLDAFLDGEAILIDPEERPLSKLALAITSREGIFVGITEQGSTVSASVKKRLSENGEVEITPVSIVQLPLSVSKLLITPDGLQLYALSGNELFVLSRTSGKFLVREIIDLSSGDEKRTVNNIQLLAGAHSLLVSHENGVVTQWFDVLTRGKRVLTYIRDITPEHDLIWLLPESYKKGFFTFHQSGVMESHYTTGENLVFSETLFSEVPEQGAVSNNERYLLTISGGTFSIFDVENAHPEISFNSLWRKVWYESYPEPQFVWQSTASSDSYEAKFSLIPLTFGTIKAALFCMLFSIPIAVLGAVYTAYFMTPTMRRVVKPTIELMEALPTVIIGFLAGMWLAPIVETNLPAVVMLTLALPISTVIIGALWSLIPKQLMDKLPNGWHALMLIPVIAIISALLLGYSGEIERQLFAGDIRVYLANKGVDFDQRNALVIGIAMGFAVIPTIFTIAEDAIFSVPKHLSDGSLALGATQWQTLTKVVLLTASPGIFSAIMMGLGRAVGETMIVLMATGNTPILDWNILEGMRTLSATIAVEMPESEVGSSHYRLLFLCALILFIFTFAVNSLAEMVRYRLRKKYSSM